MLTFFEKLTDELPHVLSPSIACDHPGVLEEFFHQNSLLYPMIASLDHQLTALELPILNLQHDGPRIVDENVTGPILITKFEIPTQDEVVFEVVLVGLSLGHLEVSVKGQVIAQKDTLTQNRLTHLRTVTQDVIGHNDVMIEIQNIERMVIYLQNSADLMKHIGQIRRDPVYEQKWIFHFFHVWLDQGFGCGSLRGGITIWLDQ